MYVMLIAYELQCVRSKQFGRLGIWVCNVSLVKYAAVMGNVRRDFRFSLV